MLQRKQSIWLLIAALLNAGTFMFDFYRFHTLESGVDVTHALKVTDHYPSLLIAVVMTLVPLVTIFLFSNRKLQLRMCIVTVLTTISFITMSLSRVTRTEDIKITPAVTGGSYWIGAVLPVAALVFVILAMLGIRRDEKLVKSVDRLR